MQIDPGILPSERKIAENLERGDVIHYPSCPFNLPEEAEHQFLLEQRLGSRAHKNIGYDPNTGKISGYSRKADTTRLHRVLAEFSAGVTDWVSRTLPRYAAGWQLDRVSYRPEEEATRKLRRSARNDLLHVDAFPSRPSNGWRILRVFANINPTEPRVWITSESFARLLERFGAKVGLPDDLPPSLWERWMEGLVKLMRPERKPRSAYDRFMLRFHNYLKANDEFQATTPRRRWEFQPGSAWLAITDTASHAVLSGRYALEHSYFLSPQTLALPHEAPAELLRKACGRPVLIAA